MCKHTGAHTFEEYLEKYGHEQVVINSLDARLHPDELLDAVTFCFDHRLELEFDGPNPKTILEILPSVAARKRDMTPAQARRFVKDLFPKGKFVRNR